MASESHPAWAPLVLFIDDAEDPAPYDLFLRFQGWKAATAVSSADGLRKAASLQPDAIVLELWMPLMDGLEIARRLKSDPSTSAIPLIALTADVQDSTRERALSAGVDDFRTKPCAPDDLVATIQRLLK